MGIPGKNSRYPVENLDPHNRLRNSSATGAGAILAVGSDTIYLSQTGIIGGAGITLSDSENVEAQKRELAQQLSLLKARARSLARVKGHRVDIVEAFYR